MPLIDLINTYAPLIGLVAPPLCGWVWWSARQKFATREEAAALRDAVAAKSAELDRLSSAIETLEEHMPDEQIMLNIQLALQEVRGDIKASNATMDGLKLSVEALSNNTAMLLQHHLDRE